MVRAILIATAGTLTATTAPSLVGQERGFEPGDYYDLVTVEDAALSPAGDLVAFTVTRVV